MLEKEKAELYQLLVSREVLEELRIGTLKHEKPDWLINDGEIGIECTTAFCKNESYTFNGFSKYLGMNIDDVPKKLLEGFEGDIISLDNKKITALNPIKGARDYIEYIYSIGECIKKKCEKLNTIYKICKFNYLLISTINGIEEDDRCSLKIEIEKNNYGVRCFDKIVIIAPEVIAVYDSTNEIKLHKLSNKKNKEIYEFCDLTEVKKGEYY